VSNIIVITFDNEDEAKKVREALKEIQHGGYISLDDSAIVVRDQKGKYHVHDELDRGVKVGALGGGFLGLLLGFIFTPIGGLLIGAAAGALIGSSFDLGISKKFIKDVEASMEPGTSALFVVVREADPTMALAALKPYKGEVYQTSLDPDDEEHLRKILSKRTNQ
jgi:uncharacterized membrane protein